MGMFDTFYGIYTCPKCGKKVDFEEQSKDYGCWLNDFKLGDYVAESNVSHFYNFQYECPFCKVQTDLSIGIKNGQYVGVYYAEDAQRMSVADLVNIEEGYQRKLDYEEMCRKKLGSEELGSANGDFVALKKGEKIRALETEWEVLEVYREEYAEHSNNEKQASLRSFFYRPTFVYRVKAEGVYRIIKISMDYKLELHCEVCEDCLENVSDSSKNHEAIYKRYQSQLGCKLKKLDENAENRFVLTKRIDPYSHVERKIKCISNTLDLMTDGKKQTIEELEIGKEYTVLPKAGVNDGNYIHIEELPSAHGYPASLFEEKKYYCENTWDDLDKDNFIKALEKSQEDVRQGIVRTLDGMVQSIRDSVYEDHKETDKDRIQGYIDILTRVWNKHPDLRFGQLIQYALVDRELWNIWDRNLFEALEKYE